MSNITWFLHHKCEDLLLFFVIYVSKWRVAGFWFDGWTKKQFEDITLGSENNQWLIDNPSTHLDVAVVALGHKGHIDREEVIGLPGDAELQAAGLVVGIDDG